MMTTLQYKTCDGDTVDLIAWTYYGRRRGRCVEQLLDANPGLADRGLVLPAGLTVYLPDIREPASAGGIRLWN
ncbi:tail protein X [Haematospirillum sp. H1815]|uniref:tail protein X n=1 Tax=Haematospirillum sp. H1815 TaxID=2723108 RepID=UPI0039F6B847